MLGKNLVYKTMYISIIIQILTSLISLHGFFIKLDSTDRILKDILGIETFVQFVETFTYIWIILSIHKIGNMTPRRYFDWMITTPIMLISTIIYMDYMYKRENEPETSLTLMGFLRDNRTKIVLIFVLNALMLLFGYMGETGEGVGLEEDAPEFEDEEGGEEGGEQEEQELVEPIEPVKNKSAYIHFKEIYVSEHHDRKYTDKELRSIWKELEDKSEYEEMAKADKRRFKQQEKDYEKAKKKYEKAKLKMEEGAETEDLTDDEAEW